MRMLKLVMNSGYVSLLFGCLVLVSGNLAADEVVVQTDGDNTFVGEWIDGNNDSIWMNIVSKAGLLRIKAGDDFFGYTLACVFKSAEAKCLGNGGKLEGEDFLYQSVLSVSPDGSMVENWNVYNNLQSLSDRTLWKRGN